MNGQGAQEKGWELPDAQAEIACSFPILDLLEAALKERKIFSGLKLGWHCHLTWFTALAAKAATAAGARLFLSECNSTTTEPEAVRFMERIGARVALGPQSPDAVLAFEPQILSDTGFVLTARYLDAGGQPVAGACEITTSGIRALRAQASLPLPVVNINDSRLKSLIENFHGVGGEFLYALNSISGSDWRDRAACVVGYGRVGAGVAHYLRSAGAHVSVVEIDPVLRLSAHYDGFVTKPLTRALTESELLVTATGCAGVLGDAEWLAAAPGLTVFNVGHWAAEVGPEALARLAVDKRRQSEHLDEFVLPDGGGGQKSVYLACGGHPANVVICKGAPEPVLIHLTTELLCVEYLASCARAGQRLAAGEQAVPDFVEGEASRLALAALKIE